MKVERIVIAILLVLLVWFSAAIVRLENYHYATEVGICENFNLPLQLSEKEDCINSTKTRSSWVWQLLYGLKIL